MLLVAVTLCASITTTIAADETTPYEPTHVVALYINLDRSPERRLLIERELTQNGFCLFAASEGAPSTPSPADCHYWAKRIVGVDGRAGKHRSLSLFAADTDWVRTNYIEWGRTASHVRAIQSAAAVYAHDPQACILVVEDDAVLSPGRLDNSEPNLLHVCRSAPAGWGTVQLAAWNRDPDVLQSLLTSPVPFTPWTERHHSTTAYLVSPHGARHILEHMFGGGDITASSRRIHVANGENPNADFLMYSSSGAPYTYRWPFITRDHADVAYGEHALQKPQ